LAVERADGVLRLTLDRPQKRNAVDDDMVAGLIDQVVAAGSDESVRAILLTGTGEHFCSGADILARNVPGNGERPRVGSIQRRLPWQAHRLIPVLLECQTPVVCAVRGWAAGIGLSLALAADVTIAAEDATFWAPYTARGFTPDGGISWILPRRVGEVRSRRMLLLGERVDGRTAAQWGLIDRAVPDADLEAETASVVDTLAKAPTVALGLAKSLLHTGRGATLENHLRDEALAMELSSRSEDFREGLAAFKEKRPPAFTGR
jgi:2-(1,2-epoxy-1,2-dihydrophenyl)acetyl-CoA isomerase